MNIDYDHAQNPHTVEGATAAFSKIFAHLDLPTSLLDVGCGIGTWMRAAIDFGVPDVRGLDGIVVPERELHVPKSSVERRDLSKPFRLQRRFDVVLCLEVAEHLPETSAEELISSLAIHTDNVLFSAACPGQPGQHHANCQWPSYWQAQFNRHGFRCDDSVRWKIWDDARVEPWYRQNVFWARKDLIVAGKEERIKSIIHPELLEIMNVPAVIERMRQVEQGSESIRWYLEVCSRAIIRKTVRRIV